MEEITIETSGDGKDYVESIDDWGESITLNFAKKTDEGVNISKVEVPKKILEFVSGYIESLNVGDKTSIIELSNDFVEHFKIKSKITEKRMIHIQDAIQKNIDIDYIRLSYIIEDLQKNIQFNKMDWVEMIGTRDTKTSNYFRLWASLRYYADTGKIIYKKSGNFSRVI